LTTEEYYAALSADFQQRAGLTGDPSTELSIRFYAVAAQLEALYNQCLWVTNQCFPQTATGTYLDNHAQMRGLSRKSPAAATGTICFLVDQPAATDLDIPAGTVCMTAGLVQFETTEAATLKAGQSQVEVPAQALEEGSAGNVAAGTIPCRRWASAPAPILLRFRAAWTRKATKNCAPECWLPMPA
jgi:uncharacterized phage protein gp47/JayE